ncbi:MAG: GntR family transcriptional regulator [Rectinemataceae bacterium]
MVQRIPQYFRVYELLRRQIEDQEYPVGSFLPPEPELGRLLNVSRTTVRKAVEMLIDEGFVYVRRGRGTEILDFKATQKLQFITSFSETLREQGFEVGYRDVKIESVPAPLPVTEDLKLEVGARVVRVHRVALANAVPIAIMVNYLVPEVVPGIIEKADRIRSLYAFMESEYNITIDAATDFISARAATRPDATQLEIAKGAPLLVVRRITYSGGTAIEHAELNIVATRYEYSVRTKDRPSNRAGRRD